MIYKIVLFLFFFSLAYSKKPDLGTSESRFKLAKAAGKAYVAVKAQIELVEFLCNAYQTHVREKYYDCMECYMKTGDTYALLGLENSFDQIKTQYNTCFQQYLYPDSIEPCRNVLRETTKFEVSVKSALHPKCEAVLSSVDPKHYSDKLRFPVKETSRGSSISKEQTTVVSLRTCLLASMMSKEVPLDKQDKSKHTEKVALETCQRMKDSGIFVTYLLAGQGQDYKKIDPKEYAPGVKP